MPDTFGVYDDMKVWEYLDFFARCYGLPAASRRRIVGDLLELVDLADKRDAYVVEPVARACSSGSAWPMRSSTTRRCCCSTSRRRASIRVLASSCASCSASCGRWARRSSSAATSCPSSRSCARASRSSTAAGSWPPGASPTSSVGLRSGAVLRIRVLAEGERARERRAPGSPTDPEVASARSCSMTARSRSPSEATTPGAARLLAAAVGAGLRGRQLRPGGERPRGAVPPGHRARRAADRARGGAGMTARDASSVAASGCPVRSVRVSAGSAPSASRSFAAGCAGGGRSSS